MKQIQVLISASVEMHDETLKFSELIANLNEVLEPRGIKLKRIKWNPETDGSLEEFKHQLENSEMCLTLFWQDLVENSEEELDTAYQELKRGNNPQKLYVFFKEPSINIVESLKGFKANFVNTYGHFFCKFENADTMNLNFILQLEAFINTHDGQFISIKNGVVNVGEREFVNLDNIPFVAFNQEYQHFQKELASLDERIVSVRKKFISEPDDLELEDELMAIKSKRQLLAGDLDKYQLRLHNIALYLVQHSGERYSERMRKARDLFEIGNVHEADLILDMEEMEREAQSQRNEYELLRHTLEQQDNNLRLGIKEFCFKADTALARVDIDINERFKTAIVAYKNALANASLINAPEIQADINMKLGDLLSDMLLMGYNLSYNEQASDYYKAALLIYKKMDEDNPHLYTQKIVEAFIRLGDEASRYSGYFGTDEDYWYIESIKYKCRMKVTPEEYPAAVADAIGDYLLDYSAWKDYRYDEAASSYKEAATLYKGLLAKDPTRYQSKLDEVIRKYSYAKDPFGRLE